MEKLVKILKSLKLLWLVKYLFKVFEDPYNMIKIIYKIMAVVFIFLILLFMISPFIEELNKKNIYLKYLNEVGKSPRIYVNDKELMPVREVLNGLSKIEIPGFSDEGRDLKDKCREIKILSEKVSMKLCLISDLHEDRYWVFLEEYAVDDGGWKPLYLQVGVLDKLFIGQGINLPSAKNIENKGTINE